MATSGRPYKTRQREMLVAFLETTNGEHLTAKTLCNRLAQAGIEIGTATVYRQLEALVDEGLVRKYLIGENEAACFEYVGHDDSCADEHCFHCLCMSCGKLYHMECDHLAEIASHLESEHGFWIDPKRTVFYGLCAECRTTAE